jgi:hypothetical protein
MGTDDVGAEMREYSQSLDPIYPAAAVPFLLLTLAALFYDSAGLYLAAVVLCVAQFVRPTRVGWILSTRRRTRLTHIPARHDALSRTLLWMLSWSALARHRHVFALHRHHCPRSV